MKIFKTILLLLFLVIAFFVLRTLYLGGVFRSLEYKSLESVEQIDLTGVEDITVDQKTGIAFLSSADRWAYTSGSPKQGGIYSLDLKDANSQPKLLTADFKSELQPHGISFFETAAGEKLLFVINHGNDEDVVEQFAYRNDTLEHRQTFRDPMLISPNDIVAVGANKFYYSNDHNVPASEDRNNKDILGIKMGEVIYFDGESYQPTGIEGRGYANGVNVSLDGERFYVAATTERHVFVYDRNAETGALTFADKVDCSSGVDNIEINTDGSLWIGAHPKTLQFLGHAKGPENISPSEIIRMFDHRDGSYDLTTVYLNDGSELSASAVGAPYKDQLLIGPVFAHHFLRGRIAAAGDPAAGDPAAGDLE